MVFGESFIGLLTLEGFYTMEKSPNLSHLVVAQSGQVGVLRLC